MSQKEKWVLESHGYLDTDTEHGETPQNVNSMDTLSFPKVKRTRWSLTPEGSVGSLFSPYVLIIIIAGPHYEWQLKLFPMDSCSASEFLTTKDVCSVSMAFNDPSIFLKLYIYDKK